MDIKKCDMCDGGMTLPVLAMIVPQPLDSVYEAEDALCRGSLFPCLDKPFWREAECKL